MIFVLLMNVDLGAVDSTLSAISTLLYPRARDAVACNLRDGDNLKVVGIVAIPVRTAHQILPIRIEFLRRYPGSLRLWIDRGQCYLGAITSRTGFFLSSFRKWREEVLLRDARPALLADLGMGVLDGAMVETAAYTLERLTCAPR